MTFALMKVYADQNVSNAQYALIDLPLTSEQIRFLRSGVYRGGTQEFSTDEYNYKVRDAVASYLGRSTWQVGWVSDVMEIPPQVGISPEDISPDMAIELASVRWEAAGVNDLRERAMSELSHHLRQQLTQEELSQHRRQLTNTPCTEVRQ